MRCSFLSVLKCALCLSTRYQGSGRPEDRRWNPAAQREPAGDPLSRVNPDRLIPSICSRAKSWPVGVSNQCLLVSTQGHSEARTICYFLYTPGDSLHVT